MQIVAAICASLVRKPTSSAVYTQRQMTKPIAASYLYDAR